MGRCVLILGGASSGKSRFAQELTSHLADKVLFVATAEALDGEMQQRIENRKKSRPPARRNIEARTGVGRRIKEESADLIQLRKGSASKSPSYSDALTTSRPRSSP